MSNFKLVKSETLPLTKALADEFQGMKASNTERDLNPRRVRHLAEKAAHDQLVAFSWAKVNLNGEWLRMNGQHSSTMLAELNGAFPEGLYVHMDSYEVDGKDGESELFRQFDDRVSSRGPMDVAGAYMRQEAALKDVPVRTGKLGIEGVMWYRRTIEGLKVETGDDRYMHFTEKGLHGFLQWLGELFTIKTPEMKFETVVAAMYATFIVNESVSREFWEHVARGGVEYEDQHPASVIANWLIDAKAGNFKEKPKRGDYYQACIYSWNANREGKDLKAVKVDQKAMLEPIA